MEMNSVFKSFEVESVSKEKGLEKTPFKSIFVDATSSYVSFLEKKLGYSKDYRKSWLAAHPKASLNDYRVNLIADANLTSAEFREWQINYNQEATKGIPNIACVICITSGKDNTCKRPYKVLNIKAVDKRKVTKNTSIVGKDSGKVYWASDGRVSKAEAVKRAKKLFTDGVIESEDVQIRLTPEISNPVICELEFSPSKAYREGKYIYFGNVDVNDLV